MQARISSDKRGVTTQSKIHFGIAGTWNPREYHDRFITESFLCFYLFVLVEVSMIPHPLMLCISTTELVHFDWLNILENTSHYDQLAGTVFIG